MKNRILFVLMLFSINCLAQDPKIYPYYDKASNRIIQSATDGVQTLHQDAVSLVKTVDERLSKAINKAAPMLKVGAENVWNTLVKQQKVWAYMYTFIACFNILLWYKWTTFVKKSNGEDSWLALSIISGAIALVGTVLIITNWSTIWTGYFNPEYGAMIQLAEFAKSL